jgi:hypothetical protein
MKFMLTQQLLPTASASVFHSCLTNCPILISGACRHAPRESDASYRQHDKCSCFVILSEVLGAKDLITGHKKDLNLQLYLRQNLTTI